MLQAIVRKGFVTAEKVPGPQVSEGCVLLKVEYSCISSGTEISGVINSGKSILKKAVEQPEKISRALNSVRKEGIVNFITEMRDMSDGGYPTGYSLSGVIVAVGEGVSGFSTGERVAAAGAGYASHAEYVNVPKNLIIEMPQNIDMASASTVALGGIALQGIRRAGLAIGEFGVIFGTGIVGLLTIQLLVAAGARVIAVDVDDRRLRIAKELGVGLLVNSAQENAVEAVHHFTGSYGADAVIITAATTDTEPLSQAFQMCKRKGRVVLVGEVGMSIKRDDMYSKELDFHISTSYGPGRYDKNYEEKGFDYPYSYVRWTENRNMKEYLRLIAQGTINIDNLTDAVYPITDVQAAFAHLQDCTPKPLIVILDYTMAQDEVDDTQFDTIRFPFVKRQMSNGRINVALIGAGSFATGTHLPNLTKLRDKYSIYAVMSRKGFQAKEIASKYDARFATTNYDEIVNEPNLDLVLISTRHDSHFDFVMKALEAGKHVLVEKPLCVKEEQLYTVRQFFADDRKEKPLLSVGFNRRFSPYAVEIKRQVSRRINPLFITYRMNAGFMPRDHWVHEDGGRIVGEACHIVDLMTYFTESKIASICVERLRPANEIYLSEDNATTILGYEDGSICTIHYFGLGSHKLSKEYMEIHFDGKSIVMDDYKSLKGFGLSLHKIASSSSPKGHLQLLEAFHGCLTGKSTTPPIPLWDLFQTTETTLSIAKCVES